MRWPEALGCSARRSTAISAHVPLSVGLVAADGSPSCQVDHAGDMGGESPPDPQAEPKQQSRWYRPFMVLSTMIWLSAFVARGAINNGSHKTFFEWYTLLVIGPFAGWCVWYLVRDRLQRRRSK